MSQLLDKIKDDDESENRITITDSSGITAEYEFLDIINYENKQYAVLCESESDGYVDIFKIENSNGEEKYIREESEEILEEVFEIFMIKNEDEYDFF